MDVLNKLLSNTKQVINLPRQEGKTTQLVKISNKTNVPILVRMGIEKHYIVRNFNIKAEQIITLFELKYLTKLPYVLIEDLDRFPEESLNKLITHLNINKTQILAVTTTCDPYKQIPI